MDELLRDHEKMKKMKLKSDYMRSLIFNKIDF